MDQSPEPIIPDPQSWERFWRFIESCDWRKAYGASREAVCDAWEWRVIAQRDGKGVQSGGAITVPDDWDEFVSLVRDLLGGRPFE